MPSSHAGETDQFMTWDLELADSAQAFNEFLDGEITTFVERANAKNRRFPDAAALTRSLYLYLFRGLHASRVRHWLKNADAVDRHPDNSHSNLNYQRLSVFRKPAFPFILPMAQTVRIGEVYCGIDKFGHMFGFGRRYFQIYRRHREAGLDHDTAVEKVVYWGIHHEENFVGGVVDGIFSHGDLEANYQGLRLALDFSQGPRPYFYREKDIWYYRGGLDIREYVTPDFDESFNPNRYLSWRHRRVAPIIATEYGDAYQSPRVQRRFARYREGWAPSHSKQIIDAYFDEEGMEPHHTCWLEDSCDAGA